MIDHVVIITDSDDSEQKLAMAAGKLVGSNNKTTSELTFDNARVTVLVLSSENSPGEDLRNFKELYVTCAELEGNVTCFRSFATV